MTGSRFVAELAGQRCGAVDAAGKRCGAVATLAVLSSARPEGWESGDASLALVCRRHADTEARPDLAAAEAVAGLVAERAGSDAPASRLWRALVDAYPEPVRLGGAPTILPPPIGPQHVPVGLGGVGPVMFVR